MQLAPLHEVYCRPAPSCITWRSLPNSRHQRHLYLPSPQQQQASRRQCSLRSTAEPVQAADLPQLLPIDENYEVAHTFAWYANWLLRGRLMLGRYPFVEPSRAKSRTVAEKHLQEILDAGITTFVCLQAELPPQVEMKLGGMNGFLPYAPTATLMAKSRQGPIPMEEVMGLRNQYLDKFLPQRRTQQQESQQPAQSAPDPSALQFVHEPITDLDIPSPDRLAALLGELERRLRAGEVIYLHCWGGRGRAGTVGATLLHQLFGLDAEEALERVQRAYSTRSDIERRLSPETDEQRAFVRSFIEARQ